MSRALGEKLGFVDDRLEELEKAALFHDIGKLAIKPFDHQKNLQAY